MRTIWKYPFKITSEQEIKMPVGAKIVCAQMQDGIPCLWIDCVTENKLSPRIIEVFGTGNAMTPKFNRQYISTIQQGQFVWHVFERH